MCSPLYCGMYYLGRPVCSANKKKRFPCAVPGGEKVGEWEEERRGEGAGEVSRTKGGTGGEEWEGIVGICEDFELLFFPGKLIICCTKTGGDKNS